MLQYMCIVVFVYFNKTLNEQLNAKKRQLKTVQIAKKNGNPDEFIIRTSAIVDPIGFQHF